MFMLIYDLVLSCCIMLHGVGFGRLGNSKSSHLTSGLSKLVDDGMGTKAKGKSGVTSYFRKREAALTRSYWQAKFKILENFLKF